jgi:hypothetical protein
LGALVACAAVAIAAAGQPMRGADHHSSRGGITPWLLGIPLVAIVMIGLLGLASLRKTNGVRVGVRRSRWLITLVFLGALLLLLVFKPHPDDARPAQVTFKAAPATSPGTRRTTPSLVWLAVGAGGALAVIGLARRPRHRVEPDETDEPVDIARQALADSAADLATTDDPRRAVIAAYARLLDGLRDVGAGRRPAEAPFEHLTRVLSGLGVREAPLRRLTALFAEARFSTHAITEDHRTAALAALDEARADLSRVVEPCG